MGGIAARAVFHVGHRNPRPFAAQERVLVSMFRVVWSTARCESARAVSCVFSDDFSLFGALSNDERGFHEHGAFALRAVLPYLEDPSGVRGGFCRRILLRGRGRNRRVRVRPGHRDRRRGRERHPRLEMRHGATNGKTL